MLSNVDDRIPAALQRKVDGQVGVGGDQCGIMVRGLHIALVASGGLDGDDGRAVVHHGEMERTVKNAGIAFGRPPLVVDRVLGRERQVPDPRRVVAEEETVCGLRVWPDRESPLF